MIMILTAINMITLVPLHSCLQIFWENSLKCIDKDFQNVLDKVLV